MTHIFKSITHDSSAVVVSKDTDSSNTQTEIPKPRDFSYPLTEIRRILVTAEKEKGKKRQRRPHFVKFWCMPHAYTVQHFRLCHSDCKEISIFRLPESVALFLFFLFFSHQYKNRSGENASDSWGNALVQFKFD